MSSDKEKFIELVKKERNFKLYKRYYNCLIRYNKCLMNENGLRIASKSGFINIVN